jgi:hypothetical protein
MTGLLAPSLSPFSKRLIAVAGVYQMAIIADRRQV